MHTLLETFLNEQGFVCLHTVKSLFLWFVSLGFVVNIIFK